MKQTTSINKINSQQPLVIGIVAGEASGDALGADFMQQMNALSNNVKWVGVGGPKMQAQGLQSIFDYSRLAVMGLVEVLKHLPDLFRARDEILDTFDAADIDMFIGVDAPDFNLRVAKKLKPQGIYCVQYVSPSVWAWRESRIHNIKKSTDLVLCLFPFELPVYERHNHPAVCVGHPLLHTIDPTLYEQSKTDVRNQLVWKNSCLQSYFTKRSKHISQLICMMPGSRKGEINKLLPLMLDTIHKLLLVDDDLCFIMPTVNANLQRLIQDHINGRDETIRNAISVIYDENISNLSQQVMAASDIVVLASGTATLEAMLLKTPMIVVYQLNNLTYKVISRLLKVPYVALPNILVNKQIVPELIQENANADNICRMVTQLMHVQAYKQQQQALIKANLQIRQQSSQSPVNAVLDYMPS